MFRVILVAAASIAVASAAWAASAPADPTAEMKSLSSLAGSDVVGALLGAEAERVSGRVFTQPTEPLSSVMDSVCGPTLASLEQGYGRYVARHVREPTQGVPRALGRMSDDFRRHVRTVGRTLPDGDPAFLLFGERLSQKPETWAQAARQRAEWASVLETLTARLVSEAERTRKYEVYAAAGLWARLDCLSARGDRAFLAEFQAAGGEAGDERTAAALELLRRRAEAGR